MLSPQNFHLAHFPPSYPQFSADFFFLPWPKKQIKQEWFHLTYVPTHTHTSDHVDFPQEDDHDSAFEVCCLIPESTELISPERRSPKFNNVHQFKHSQVSRRKWKNLSCIQRWKFVMWSVRLINELTKQNTSCLMMRYARRKHEYYELTWFYRVKWTG